MASQHQPPRPTARVDRVLSLGTDEADSLGHGFVTCQHLLYALAREGKDGVERIIPEPEPEPHRDPTPFQRLVTSAVHVMGLLISAPYEDESLMFLLGGLLMEARLWLYRRRRKGEALDSMLDASKPASLGAVAERKMREIADARVDERISEETNLLRTEITILRGALADYLTADQIDEVVEVAAQTPGHPAIR